MAADLYGDIVEGPRPHWRDTLPGLAVVAAATLAAGFLADRYGAPLTLMALLIGLSLNFLSADARLHAGLNFASRDLLRWGIVLVGARVTFGQIADLGLVALATVAALIALTIGAAVLIARRLGFDRWFGMLVGGAVAICGASAALAVATTLGPKRVSQAQLTLVLIGISAMSAAAMVLYPMIAHALGYADVPAGFLLGAAIHDVAQAIGAGYSYSPTAGQVATIVKLSRVALLAPVLMALALFLPRGERGGAGIGVPWFVVGFFLVAGVNSTGVIPDVAVHALEAIAAALLAAAVAATAIRSPLGQLLRMGGRPFAVIALATLALLILATAASALLIA
ncbi:YeiH family protein [Sphingomonas sp.]|uniref:YeiH family protein n=1 Tax=Sphingomonas sp. TaxID=28214 RepID=UPI002DD67719|nr:putative sulfate exporter family transporter [Sphingomonas sp.]